MAGVTPPPPPAAAGTSGQAAATTAAATARSLGEVVLEQVPARLAELGRTVVLTGTPDGRTPEGALRLRTQMGEILLRPAEAFAPDKPVTLQIPAASPPGTLPARAFAFTAAATPPAAAPPAAPAMAGPAPAPSGPTAILLPGTVLPATIVAAGPAAPAPVPPPGPGIEASPMPLASAREAVSSLPQTAAPRGVPASTATAAYGAIRGNPAAGGPPAPTGRPALVVPASLAPAAGSPASIALPASPSFPAQGPAVPSAPGTAPAQATRQGMAGQAVAPDISPAGQVPPERGGTVTLQSRPAAGPPPAAASAPAAETSARQASPPPPAAGTPAFPAAGLRPGTAVILHVLSLPAGGGQPAPAVPPAAGPTPPPPSTPMPAGPSLGGVVTGMSASSGGAPQAVLSTAQGAVLVQPGTPLAIGTRVALTLAPAAPPPFDPLNGTGWPNLQRTLDALAQIDAGGARALLMQILPQAGPRLAAAIAHFTNTVGKGAEARRWVGEPAARLLEAEGRDDLLSALDGDFKTMGRQAAEPMQGDWRIWSLPFSNGQEISRIRLFVRKADDEEEAEGSGRPGGRARRFVLDLELSRLGPIQLDGLVRDKRFDLILRMRDPFPDDMRREIQGIFTRTLAALGLNGDASFQPGGRGWVTIQPKPGAERGFLA